MVISRVFSHRPSQLGHLDILLIISLEARVQHLALPGLQTYIRKDGLVQAKPGITKGNMRERKLGIRKSHLNNSASFEYSCINMHVVNPVGMMMM